MRNEAYKVFLIGYIYLDGGEIHAFMFIAVKCISSLHKIFWYPERILAERYSTSVESEPLSP